MREIKFRAWDKRTNEMQGEGGWFLMQQNGVLASHGAMRGIMDEPIEHYEVMQYTGLKDKNGVEIYEGDVLNPCRYKTAIEFSCCVIFSMGMFCLKENGRLVQNKKPLYKSLDLGVQSNNEYEVIGNIYSDKHLLDN